MLSPDLLLNLNLFLLLQPILWCLQACPNHLHYSPLCLRQFFLTLACLPSTSAVSPPSSSPVLPSLRWFLLHPSAWSVFPLKPPPCSVKYLPDVSALLFLWSSAMASSTSSRGLLILGSLPLGDFYLPGLFGMGFPGTWVSGLVPVAV